MRPRRIAHVLLLGLLMGGCQAAGPAGGARTDADLTNSNSATDGGMTDLPLSYQGKASGTVATVSSTAGRSDGQTLDDFPSSSGQSVPAAAVGWFTNLDGTPLQDAEGNEYPSFSFNADGTYEVEGLPVGVDIVLNIDYDGDGIADLMTVINIPKALDDDTGSLDDVTVDPLSTLIYAKFMDLLEAQGIDPEDVDLSPSALIHRIRDAYEHLFGDAGIEGEITLEDILNLSDDELAALFDTVVPPSARRGMEMTESNIALAVADDVQDVVRAVAQLLVQGGFTIADDPGGVDLSSLADLPHVQAYTFEEFHQMMDRMGGEGDAPPPDTGTSGDPSPPDTGTGGDPPPPDTGTNGSLPSPDKGINGSSPPAAQAEPEEHQPVIYISDLAEVDRNYANSEDGGNRGHHGPMFSEHLLGRMAELYLQGKTISLRNLYRVTVDLQTGMGARLFYGRWNGPGQPPTEVFESADGTGVELRLMDLFRELDALHLEDPSPEAFEQQQAELRRILVDFFAETVEPGIERLFGGILVDRVGSAEDFGEYVREARAHLPFSRSGPAAFYVVADSDPFRDENAAPITVDIETDERGRGVKVTYSQDGTGTFYVGFGPMSEHGMQVELISLRGGSPLHDHEGAPQFLDIADGTIFQPVNGESFFEAFSETVYDYAGAPALRIANYDFDPSLPPDPETNPPDFEAFVLMTEHGPNGVPVRVDYENGVAMYNAEGGRYYLQWPFYPEAAEQGLFELITETGQILEAVPGDPFSRVLLSPTKIQGIELAPQAFTHVYGTEAPNHGYDPSGAPYYDDINGNDAHDEGEPTFAWREFLFDANDWRSTCVERYYRRADNNGFVRPEEVNWEADTPQTVDGVALVPRDLKPRLNAFRFGRPNVTINLLAAFAPADFFDGTHGLHVETQVNPFMALAILNLVLDSIHNVVAEVDFDGPGPMPAREELIDAMIFVAPIGDPLQLITDGFENLAEGEAPQQ